MRQSIESQAPAIKEQIIKRYAFKELYFAISPTAVCTIDINMWVTALLLINFFVSAIPFMTKKGGAL